MVSTRACKKDDEYPTPAHAGIESSRFKPQTLLRHFDSKYKNAEFFLHFPPPPDSVTVSWFLFILNRKENINYALSTPTYIHGFNAKRCSVHSPNWQPFKDITPRIYRPCKFKCKKWNCDAAMAYGYVFQMDAKLMTIIAIE